MKPSKYQEAIYEWVRTGRGHAFVDAVAGSGKTTTALEAAKLLPRGSKARFLAFNKSIAEELGGRLQGTAMTASTIHALGRAAIVSCAQVRVDASKYRKMTIDFIDEALTTWGLSREKAEALREHNPVSAIVQTIEKVRLTLTDPTDTAAIERLVHHFNIEIDPSVLGFVFRAVECLTQTRVRDTFGVIDFADMIYLPVVDPTIVPPQFDWLFVDESQDLSPCQLALVLRSISPKGRMLFVGDPYQAIYGFAGADSESVNRIIEKTEATVLPLSVCYRCPTKHLEWARSIVPHIEARDGAPEGSIAAITGGSLGDHVDPTRNDLVLCRFNAPLVSSCLALLARGIPAKMRGRDIGASLVAFIQAAEKFGKRAATTENIDDLLTAYCSREIEKLLVYTKGDMDDSRIAALHDKQESVLCVWVGHKCASTKDFSEAINALFADEARGVVMFSSIHRAKGLEANHVFLLQPESMPRRTRAKWEQAQEANLLYVALTRAKEALTFVSGEDGCYTGTHGEFADLLASVPVQRPVGVEPPAEVAPSFDPSTSVITIQGPVDEVIAVVEKELDRIFPSPPEPPFHFLGD
jgi:DNA helicase-2/ATP-dependent DNA helicase PcrA